MAAPLCNIFRAVRLGCYLPPTWKSIKSSSTCFQRYCSQHHLNLFVKNRSPNSMSFVNLFRRVPGLYNKALRDTHIRPSRTFYSHLGVSEHLRTQLPKCNGRYVILRPMSSGSGSGSGQSRNHRTVLVYICSIGIFMTGAAYAGVPLYRMFCQATGLGGQAVQGHDTSKVETMQPNMERVIRVRFNADTASSMQWNFRPQQSEIRVLPGETALAFYTAKNPTDKPIIGISTYNVIPFEAGQYFNKIQCFCFEEQRLNPHEQVDMPVFFYIDPEYAEDPKLEFVDLITLSYTFFEAKEGLQLPLPGYVQHVQPPQTA